LSASVDDGGAAATADPTEDVPSTVKAPLR
jgi:hypothetical protein